MIFNPKSGLANPMTATGDIIYSSDNNGTPAKLVASTDGKVLSLSGGIPAWSGVSSSFTYLSKTGTYNPAVINDWILCSSTSFTITLPTAASVAGQSIVIQHNGTSLTQVYTLATTSSQTIGGVAGGSYALYTNGEVLHLLSDGSNWQILNHRTTTGWVSYTPTITGLGTVSGPAFFWRRDGDTMHIRGTVTAGTLNGVQFSFSLPSPAAIDTTKNPTATGTPVGRVQPNGANSDTHVLTQTGTSTTLLYAGFVPGASPLSIPATTATGSQPFISSAFTGFDKIWIPISGWQP